MKAALFSLFILSLASRPVSAGFEGSISFSEEERSLHLQKQDQVLSVAASCLEADMNRHQEFFRRHGFSPFYGDRSSFGKLSYGEKRNYLSRMGKNSMLLKEMEATSCVGLVLKCLGKGFRAAGQGHLWERIRKFTQINGVDGTAMQEGLRQLGWKLLYWNPDMRMNREWDRAEREKDPTNKDRFWGYHENNWQGASKRSRYLYNHLDDARLLVNFGNEVPRFLKEIPFFVGTGHGGYHVFPGTYGRVIESHSTRLITDRKSLESDDFNPLAGRAPTGGMYRSGMIAIPAKYFR
jgi:hypothetical protein